MTGPARQRTGTAGPGPGDDHGSGTVLGLVLMAFVLVLVVMTAALGEAYIARHRAMSGADLVAIAAADAAWRADPDPCATAAHVAERQSAVLVGCRVTGLAVDVTVTVAVGGLLGPGSVAEARARAGPSEP